MVTCCSTSEVTVALSGTLDTFALPDVLRLLASTDQTGRLRVTGPKGSGSVWLDSGEVVAADMVGDQITDSSNVEVMFGLLRLETGSFTFEDDARGESDSPSESMDKVLAEAESMLAEWREIESVVPSMDVWVGLCQELSGPDVMVDVDRWRGIAAVGSGSVVVDLARRLELREVAVCRLVKELIELGLVELIEPQDEAEAVSVDETPMVETVAVDDPESDLFGSVDDVTRLDPLLSAGDPLSEIGHIEEKPEPSHSGLFSGSSASEGSDDQVLNPAEMARQLANLSPRAAKAVAEAARATTDAERDAALDAVEAEDETVNRGLLLKFLGSVDS